MKNLKKLTRKGLDELANEMPQVNELQQQECVGGIVCFDQYGNYLGVAGINDTIKICSLPDYMENIFPEGYSVNSLFSSGSIWIHVDPDDCDGTPLAGMLEDLCNVSNAQYNVVGSYLGLVNNYSGLEIIGNYGSNTAEIDSSGFVTFYMAGGAVTVSDITSALQGLNGSNN
jgi:hypothetical protein